MFEWIFIEVDVVCTYRLLEINKKLTWQIWYFFACKNLCFDWDTEMFLCFLTHFPVWTL